jgi:predicted nucleic acid-binding protein
VNVLVDTSVWSLALRRVRTDLAPSEGSLVAELTELIKEGRARIIGPIRQELLSGIKTAAQFEKLIEILAAFPDEPIETGDYVASARLGNLCRSKGIAVSPVDMLICAIAASRGWSIFTADSDFQGYARVLEVQIHAARRF